MGRLEDKLEDYLTKPILIQIKDSVLNINYHEA